MTINNTDHNTADYIQVIPLDTYWVIIFTDSDGYAYWGYPDGKTDSRGKPHGWVEDMGFAHICPTLVQARYIHAQVVAEATDTPARQIHVLEVYNTAEEPWEDDEEWEIPFSCNEVDLDADTAEAIDEDEQHILDIYHLNQDEEEVEG